MIWNSDGSNQLAKDIEVLLLDTAAPAHKPSRPMPRSRRTNTCGQIVHLIHAPYPLIPHFNAVLGSAHNLPEDGRIQLRISSHPLLRLLRQVPAPSSSDSPRSMLFGSAVRKLSALRDYIQEAKSASRELKHTRFYVTSKSRVSNLETRHLLHNMLENESMV